MTETDLPPAMLRGVHMERLMPSLGQRERATLGGMVVAGKIGTAELVAANRWFRDWAMAEHGAFEGGDNVKPSEALKMFPAEIMAAAITSYREAAEAVGEEGFGMLVAVLCDGQSLRDWAWHAGVSRGVPQRRMVDVLRALARHYTQTDARGKKV